MGDGLEDIIRESMYYLEKLFDDTSYAKVMADILEHAVMCAHNDKEDSVNLNDLGEGWVGEEALAVAVYCAVRYQDDFSKGLRVSVNHSGDSDSTGAIMGNILGAMIGYDAIPSQWKEKLECHGIICKVAKRLVGEE